MMNFIYPPQISAGFTYFQANSISTAQVTVYIDNLSVSANTVTTNAPFTVTIAEGVPPNSQSIYPANFAYTIVLNVSANGSLSAAQAASTYNWTFTDHTNNSCTATFSIPTISVLGTSGQIGNGSNGSTILYTSNSLNFLYSSDSPFYQTVVVGNSVTLNVLGCLAYENTYTITVDNISGQETIVYSNATANGVFNYTAVVNASSDPYSFIVSGFGYYDPYTPNTVAGGGFTVQSPVILFDQTTLVANSSLFSGYAFTTVYTSYPPSTVSLYANGTLIGNAITSNTTGSWTYVPSLSAGTYSIVAAAKPQLQPYNNVFTWAYSNASTTVVISGSPPVAPNIAITYPSNSQTVYSTLIEGTTNVVGTVHLYNGNVAIANVSSPNYTWSATPSLSYGTYTITAEIANTSGIAYANVSFDYAAPINIRLQWDTGVSPTDNVSSQSTIIGTTFANSTVSVYDATNGFLLGVANTDGNGNFLVDYNYTPGNVSLNFQTQQGNTVYQIPFSFYFTATMGTNEYLQAFFNELPDGWCWPKFQGSNLYTALLPLMNSYRRINGRLVDFFSESYPATPYELLPEWEASLGLVATDGESIVTRQENVLAKFLANGGLTIPYYEAVANTLGYNIAVQEYAPFRAGVNKAGQQLAPPSAFFVWTVTANSAAQATSLANTITTLSPAHTIVYYNYD